MRIDARDNEVGRCALYAQLAGLALTLSVLAPIGCKSEKVDSSDRGRSDVRETRVRDTELTMLSSEEVLRLDALKPAPQRAHGGGLGTGAQGSGAQGSGASGSATGQSPCGPCQGSGKSATGGTCGSCGGSGSSAPGGASNNSASSGSNSTAPASGVVAPSNYGAGGGGSSGGTVGLQSAAPGGGGPQVDQRTKPTTGAQSGAGGGSAGGGGGSGTAGEDPTSNPRRPTTPETEAESRRGAPEANPGTRAGDAATAPRDGTLAPSPAKAEQRSKTPGSAVPRGQEPEREQAAGGTAGKSVGAAESKGETAPRADGATRAESVRPAEAPAEDARDTRTPTGDGNGGEPAKIEDLNSIELPELEIEALEADQSALVRAGNTRTIDAHPLSGVWEQIDGPNSADFGPGGYDRSIVMLNPGTRIAAVYRVFRGSIAIVMGGELALDLGQDDGIKREGTAELRVDPSLPSRFPASRLPLGGNPARFTEPPVPGNPWRLEWRRDQLQLVLGDKRYAPSTVEAFESIRRGGGDVATPDEASERAPARPAVTTGAGPKPKEAAFFGVRGGGKRFVFIVDVSGSMLGAKLDRLKEELTKSVRALERDAEFSIVFFAGDAQVIDQSWMTASSDRDRAIQLIARQGCSGGTDPTKAFDFAFKTLSPIPDCVFFMTDGQIPPWIPDHVRALNSARIPSEIHTIVVGAPAEEPAMRPHMERIANENHGTYTFVPQ